jgi:broad specificity phosphatase PhoE
MDLKDRGDMMSTTLYLLRHAATAANLAKPPKLLGRYLDPPLARLGVRQAEATRDFLAVRSIDLCFCSPMRRAVQTATIVASPHGLAPIPIDALTECDLGAWEGKSWPEIRAQEPHAYRAYMSDPGENGYPGGENFLQVQNRIDTVFDDLLRRHEGKNLLIVSHHVVNRVYLAGVLGLSAGQARQVSLDNCGISVVTRESGKNSVAMLNASFHIQGVAG